MKQKKKKKVDYEALHSPFMRIPGMDIATARDLIDLGFRFPDQLAGRAPEALFAELETKREEVPRIRLAYLRMAIYFAETPDPDPAKLTPWAWND